MLVIKLIYASFLRNQRAGKFQKFTKLNSSAYSLSKNEKFVNTSKKLLKTRYQTFSVMRFFTYKVFPNILSTTLTLKKRKCKQKTLKPLATTLLTVAIDSLKQLRMLTRNLCNPSVY